MVIDVSEDLSASAFSAQEVQVNFSDPEHGGSNLLWNITKYLSIHISSFPRNFESCQHCFENLTSWKSCWIYVNFYVFWVVLLKVQILWNVTMSRYSCSYQSGEGLKAFFLSCMTLRMKTVWPFETLVTVYQLTWCNTLEDSNFCDLTCLLSQSCTSIMQ